ncbi:hypothetical protein [Gorillibacterium timonense]|uniref:hypothetical protein n=1 Tax=Gorillibacterium timonense TaxID=1689269 RepID=UPI00071D7B52|nr:hypothetical protein [Gorillibacterium timonense]
MDKAREDKNKYVFTVDILIEGYNNGIALETLLHILNQDKIADYDIRKGIAIGKTVQAAAKQGGTEIRIPEKAAPLIPDKGDKNAPAKAERTKAETAKAEAEAAKPEPGKAEPGKADTAKPVAAQASHQTEPTLIELLEKHKQSNALVRLTVLKGKGVRLNLPCRILSFDQLTDTLTVYHVDEKKVYQFRMTEVEDFTT